MQRRTPIVNFKNIHNKAVTDAIQNAQATQAASVAHQAYRSHEMWKYMLKQESRAIAKMTALR